MIGIYKITSPSGRIYIGQSIDIRRRFRNYKNLKCKEQPKLYNSFLKYGVDAHRFEIIEICLPKYLNNVERYYQEFYNSIEKGLNLIYVNSDNCSGIHSEETKLKISKAAKGKKKSPEHLAKLWQNQKGAKMPKRSEEFKKTQSLNNGKNRAVIQMDLDGNYIAEFRNIMEACRQLGVSRNISACCLGKLATSGGFKWKYKDC